MPSSSVDLFELVKKLKLEKLFVSNERREIEGLNRKVQVLSTGLLHEAWLTGQHRLSLENLSRGHMLTPFSCSFVNHSEIGNSAEGLELIEAHKLISPRYLQSYTDLIGLLRNHPDVVALCISTYEKEKHFLIRSNGQTNISVSQILHAIINLYGGIGGPLPGDGTLHLKLLSVLAGHQLVGAESPRKILRQESSAFSAIYRLISETIPSSRLFLVGALHEPVTQLLSSQELLCLGTSITPTSPLSVMEAASTSFASPSNKDLASVDRTEKMARLTKLFIDSILDNIHAFPTSLAWLIKSVHSQLSVKHPEKEVNTICTDLIWLLFICPAVTNPEPFGVTDALVGTLARHTLSQVATILQALALNRWEGTDPRLREYISYFDSGALTSVLDHVLSMEGLPIEQTMVLSCLSRRTILLPENQLQPLFFWLNECLLLLERNGKLTDIDIWPTLVKHSASVNESVSSLSLVSGSLTPTGSSTRGGNSPVMSGSPTQRPKTLMNGKTGTLLSARKADGRNATPPNEMRAEKEKPVSVVVFPLTQQPCEWVGMLPEAEVISCVKISKPSNGAAAESNDMDCLGDDAEDDDREDRSILGEKRTRFSSSQDDGSIGTSDNLEAVSEAASTHSVSSSIELEDQNDNLSDMLSANVSGRGTPNVSGRNTPLSQAEEQDNGNEDEPDDVIMNDPDDDVDAQAVQQNAPMNNNLIIHPPNMNNLNLNGPTPNPSKQARSEIEDKFCKFEIKKMFGGDETVSLVSDTWSTDVLASDSEMGGDGSRLLLPLPGPLDQGAHADPTHRHGRPNVDVASIAVVGDVNQYNETMSEAWSTDVAASDIERLHDFDTEETASVARSDDTARSELEGAAYDTPRSSVSGGGPYRPQEQDLLLFDDVRPSNPSSGRVSLNGDKIADADAVAPSSPGTEGDICGQDAMAMDIALDADNIRLTETSRTLADTFSSIAQEILIPEIVSPSSQALSSGGVGNTLQTPGTSSGSRTGVSIPKTITFDKTAERGDREHWDDESGRTKRFFRNFRLPFRGRSRKPRGGEDRFDWERMPENPSLPVPKLRKSFSEDVDGPTSTSSAPGGLNESSDEILAKYRRKPSLTDSTDSPATSSPRDMKLGSGNVIVANPPVGRKDSIKITRSEFVIEARRKLRNVLSNCDLELIQPGDGNAIDTALINLLRIEVASAISRANQVSAAQLHEAIRTVKQLGVEGCRKVIRHLRDDYRRRSDYIAYLMRAKQGLLSTIQFLERATVRAKHEGDTYNHYLLTECVRLWLEEPDQENLVVKFADGFRPTKTADEKTDALEDFLCTLVELFVGNRDWTEWQLAKIESALEQNIVARIYLHALYPNGEADLHRDGVLKEHIARLDAIITPSHRDLRIPKSQLGECPWPPAQRELRMLSAYKTASDKLRCIIRASSLIVNMLSSSSEKAVAADDFVPVLVYVIIKSNPPALLSTIQYVNGFCGQKITGEDQYWWTQFCSAVEFIKTMDYNE